MTINHESDWTISERTARTPSLGGIVFSRLATGPEGVIGSAHVTVLPQIREEASTAYDRMEVAIDFIDRTVEPPHIGRISLSYDLPARAESRDPSDYLSVVDNALFAGQMALAAAYNGAFLQFQVAQPEEVQIAPKF